MREVVIVSAARTALGSFGGSLASVPAVELGAVAIRAALSRGGVDAGMVEEVVMGNVLQAGLGQNPARQAAVKAGIPMEIPAWTVNKVCGSGLKAVAEAALAIRAGEARCVVAGGMENMSLASYVLPSARWGGRMGDAKLVDEMIRDGLWDAFNDYHMGITAENVRPATIFPVKNWTPMPCFPSRGPQPRWKRACSMKRSCPYTWSRRKNPSTSLVMSSPVPAPPWTCSASCAPPSRRTAW